jgi:hypothetical protein
MVTKIMAILADAPQDNQIGEYEYLSAQDIAYEFARQYSADVVALGYAIDKGENPGPTVASFIGVRLASDIREGRVTHIEVDIPEDGYKEWGTRTIPRHERWRFRMKHA